MTHRRLLIQIALLALAAVVLAACTQREADDAAPDDDEVAEATATVSPTETPEVETATETPDASDDSDPIRDLEEYARDTPIEPEGFYLESETGEQTGWPRNFFWSDPEEIAAVEMQGNFLPLHDDPLAVTAGESLTLSWERDDIDPEEIAVNVYEREGNFEEDVETRDGLSDAFFPRTDPIDTVEVDPDEANWEVDLDAGEYFLLVDTVWPTPEGWPRDRSAQFGFWIVVE